MIGIEDALEFVSDVINGEEQVKEAKRQSDSKMKKQVAGITALALVAGLGIKALTNNDKQPKVR